MTEVSEDRKILFVDDDQLILDGYKRQMRRDYQIDIALGGNQGLAAVAMGGPYAVVVSDMRMPGMDGVEFLSQVRSVSPNSVRIMLTGNSDQQTAIDAVNEGNIFRFLNKPCPAETLNKALNAAFEQYDLINAEKQLLEKTLGGTIRALMEILSAVDPESFGRLQTVRKQMQLLAKELGQRDTWVLDLAAMLSQIGLVTIPSSIVRKARVGNSLTEAEQAMLQRVPEVSHNLLIHIPRLEPVAKAVLYQNKNYDGSGFPQDAVARDDIPAGARMLKALLDFAKLEATGLSKQGAFSILQRHSSDYDPEVLKALMRCLSVHTAEPLKAKRATVPVLVKDLKIGFVLADNIDTPDGRLLLSAGMKLTETLLEKLRNLANLMEIKEPVMIEAKSVVAQ